MSSTTERLVLRVWNTSVPSPDGDGYHDWTVHVSSETPLRRITFRLHPTFTPSAVTVDSEPFQVSRRGWGTFTVGVDAVDQFGNVHSFDHGLVLNEHGSATATHAFPTAAAGNTRDADTVAHGNNNNASNESNVGKDSSEGVNISAPTRSPAPPTSSSSTAFTTAAPSDSTSISVHNPENDAKRMEDTPWESMHGTLGDPNWPSPIVAVSCDQEARPGYTSRSATEYTEDPATFSRKIEVLAKMVSESSAVLAYTGAGLSVASGIGDYATKASNSVAKTHAKRPKLRSNLDAKPTIAHRVLGEMHRRGELHMWLQQNHDGLPQKAGVPQEAINEIHGAWHDPSNPVVPMTGSLRGDLCEQMYEWEKTADVVLALGSSLCGMNADRVVTGVAKRAKRGSARGAVIVTLQQTQYDDQCALRIYGLLDDVMSALASRLGFPVPAPFDYAPRVPREHRIRMHVFSVPYDKSGRLCTGRDPRRPWDLSRGSKVRVTSGPGKGFTGEITGMSHEGHYQVALPCQREGSPNHGKGRNVYLLGSWWVDAAIRGAVPRLPIVNIKKGEK